MLPQYLVTSHIFGHANRILCCRHKEDRSLFLFSFFFMEGQKPNNNLKRSHIAKVCYFLYNLFWLCLSFPLHIFFFYLPDDPFVVGFVILNEKNGPLVSIILLLKTGLDENKALSYTSSILKVKSMSSSEILPS